MKKGIAALLCLCALLGLGGCADAKEIDDTAFILTLGVDKGSEKTYEFSFQLPILADEDSPAFRTMTCQAEGLTDAVALLNANTPYRVDFSHLNFLVLGKQLAEEGVSRIIDPLMRLPQVRKGAMVIVAQQSAGTFVEALQSDEETNLMQLQQSILSEAGASGLFPYCSLDMFYDSLHSGREDAVVALGAKREPADRPGGGTALSDLPENATLDSQVQGVLLGAAVFHGDRMAGQLNGEQTRAWCMVAGQFENGGIAVPNPFEGGLLTLQVKADGPPKAVVALEGQTPAARFTVPLSAYLVSYAGEEDYEAKIKNNEITPLVERYLQGQWDELCALFAGWQVDAFGAGRTAAEQFSTQTAWNEYNWQARREGMTVRIEPALEILLYRPALGEKK